jgi:hypothetical protein
VKFITWFSTHLALESLFIWTFIGSNLRENFLKSRKNSNLFLITSLASLGSDLDYLIRLSTNWISGIKPMINNDKVQRKNQKKS